MAGQATHKPQRTSTEQGVHQATENIPEEEQVPMKKWRSLVGSPSALLEQLGSVVPQLEDVEERLHAAFEIVQSWGEHNCMEMPAAVQAWYVCVG